MKRLWIAAAALLFLLAPAGHAAAAGPAEVLTADGAYLAGATSGSFRYPADGSVVSIASVKQRRHAVELDGIELLHGRVQASRLIVTSSGHGSVEDLVVDGLRQNPNQNGLVALDSSSYLVVLQKAVIRDRDGRRVGLVGLRLSVAAGAPDLPNGAQVLVGLAGQGGMARRSPLAAAVSNANDSPWAMLGFSATPRLAGGGSLASVTEPLLGLPSFYGSTKGASAVAIAERFLGVPYRWGGADPVNGFDCSGLTMFVYHQLGVSLIHYAAAQFHEGTPVPEALLQPGDLVFFDPSALGPGHEGIYIGGGEFIHAPHTGDVVKISPLQGHYARMYVGAVRPFTSP